MNWLRQWSDAFSTNTTIAFSNYFNDKELNASMSIVRSSDSESEEEEEEEEERNLRNTERVTNEDNKLKDLTFKVGNALKIGQNNQVELGVQVTSNKIDYNYSATNFMRPGEDDSNDDSNDPTEPINLLDISDTGTQYTAYLQDRVSLFKKVTLTPGIRTTYFDLTGEFYIEPRFSLIIDLSEKIKIKGAWGKYYQFANNLVREDILQGDRDFWMLSDEKNIPVSSAIHYTAGISYETRNFLFDIEAYYKDMKGLSEYAYRFTPRMQAVEEIDYSDFFYHGTGTAKGIEFLLQKKYGRYTGWVCYTLGDVEYNFPDFGDDPFPASHDVTHEFKLVNSFKIKKWTFSATWIFATGRPYTEPLSASQETIYNERLDREIVVDVIEYGPKNGGRLPDYHRLDVSVNFDFEIGNTKTSIGASIFNVYNHKNIWRKEYDIAENELIETNVTYMGFTPSLFFKITF
jgi:outer membrane receptor for ferrienterochelin and colicin